MNFKKFLINIGLMAVIGLLTSCSVVMAAKNEGTCVENILASRCRGQILAQGARVISSDRLPSGDLVEVYQFKKARGSAARAFMHGVLDVSTCGIWEVVGTPMEACMHDDRFYVMRVYYDCQDNVTKMEFL